MGTYMSLCGKLGIQAAYPIKNTTNLEKSGNSCRKTSAIKSLLESRHLFPTLSYANPDFALKYYQTFYVADGCISPQLPVPVCLFF